MKTCFYSKLGAVHLAVLDLVDLEDGQYLVTRINVPKPFRGQKIGSALLDEMLAAADSEAITLKLEVVSSDGLDEDQLIAWYKSRGFNHFGHFWVRTPRPQSSA